MALTRLKQLREEAVLTVHELAEASGVSDDTISKIENGQRVARPNTLRKLAHALNVSPQELRRPARVEEPVPLAKAPREAGLPAKEESIFDLAHDAILRKHRADKQAANRTISSEGIRQPARFQEYENALVPVLLGRDPGEVAGEFIELMHGYVRLEQKIAQVEEENARLREEAERESVHQ
jgi:transcriptional regulator with XRE-family HTH domain